MTKYIMALEKMYRIINVFQSYELWFYINSMGQETAVDCWSYLCGLSEDEFRVFNQTLKRDRHVNDLCPLMLPTVVRDKFSIPGVEDDKT